PCVRKYLSVDGGMMDNPRPALYGSQYEALLANRANAKATEVVSIAGRACESGDMLMWDVPLPRAKCGDLLAMLCTGAYQYAMASNYNRVPVPAVVLVQYGKASLMVARQRWEDVAQYDRMPAWLDAGK
ncbi:MAG: diaminopimelate decarboxylase, partial [Clostridia bacterium]